MSDQIVNNQFAYKGKPAWHGKGFGVPADATGEEMLTIAGLNWPVQRRALAMRNAFGKELVTDPLADFRAIVRADNDKVFQVATAKYHPVQNRDIVDFFREFCEAGHASMETVGALRDGAVVWALAKLNGGTSAELAGGDELRGHLMMATSHDGSLKTIAKPTQTRVVCGNTLAIALGEKSATYTLKHSSKFSESQKAEARRVIGMASAQIARTNEVAAKLSQTRIDQSDWMEFMSKLIGSENVLAKRDKDQTSVASQMDGEDALFWESFISNVRHGHQPEASELSRLAADIQESTITSPGSDMVSARGTLWGAVNGVTHYVDHVSRARNDSNRLFSAWFGDGERLKNDAVRVAVEMAGITVPAASSAR